MMIPAAAFLFFNSLYLMLRVSPASGSFPRPLSAEEEREALEKCAAGDLQARNTLIEHNLRLVAHVIKKYYAAREEQDDLISIGTSKGARLATYASRCIENEILMYFRSRKKQACEVSLSEPIDSDKDGNVLSLVDVISCDDDMLERLELSERQQQLIKSVNTVLDERERQIVVMRYGEKGAAKIAAGAGGLSLFPWKSRLKTQPAVVLRSKNLPSDKKPAESKSIQRAPTILFLDVLPFGEPNAPCDGPKALLHSTIIISIIPFCFFQTRYWAIIIGGVRDFRRISETAQTGCQTAAHHTRSNYFTNRFLKCFLFHVSQPLYYQFSNGITGMEANGPSVRSETVLHSFPSIITVYVPSSFSTNTEFSGKSPINGPSCSVGQYLGCILIV